MSLTLPGSPLSTADQEHIFQPRWIDLATTERSLLRRVDSQTGASLIGRNGPSDYSGVAIGVRWPGEPHVREWILRRDHPEFEIKADGSKKPRGKYLMPPGRGHLLYLPADADPALLTDTSIEVWITEGPLKCVALWRAAWHSFGDAVENPRALPVAINGVYGFRGTVGKDFDEHGARVDVKGTLNDFARIEWRGRRTVIIFDADEKSNASVRAARRELTRTLQDRGASVAWFAWPKDRPAEANGIDDFLAVRGPEETLKLIAYAKVQATKRKPAVVTEPAADGPRPLTEIGNAERLTQQYGANFRYCAPMGKFMVHDGRRWLEDEMVQMERWAKSTVRAIYTEAAAQGDSAVREATAAWALKSEKAAAVRAMLQLATSEEGIPIRPAEFDADPWLFNLHNGTLDLRTGTLRPHRREDLITKLAGVEFNPAATCPRWKQFLAEVFEPHPDVPEFLQRFAGYSMSGDTREECLAILYGSGRNGKGTLLKILDALFGDYAGTSDFATFVCTRDDRGPRDDIANMRGRRLISAQEGKDGAVFAESIIKWLSGGDRVRARKLHENSYEFSPTWKIWLASNFKPIIRGTDIAIWSRIRLVPFDVTFEGREDKTLKTALIQELPGILNWVLAGCMDWQKDGLPLPASVAAATSEYRAESDVIGRFIDECCNIHERLSVKARAIYSAYKLWAQQTGELDVMTETAFGRRLAQKFKKDRDDSATTYEGIALKTL
jgi:putative DNA primase/helicase